MEVILLEEVPGLGGRGTTVKVSPGYARNYLLPRKLAIAAADNTANLFRTLARQRETREAKLKRAAEELAAKLEGTRVTIAGRASEEGVLYGSVSAADVAERLEKKGFPIERRMVQMEEHIKNVGEVPVTLRLAGGVTATVTVEVVSE